jgi:hypothetical protein
MNEVDKLGKDIKIGFIINSFNKEIKNGLMCTF